MINKKEFTTYDVSRICGVSMPTIIGWIEQDKLKAYKTVGGHRRVRRNDLTDFLKAHKMPVPEELAPAGRLRILIVDDDLSLVNLMVRSLNGWEEKHESKVSSDGFDAGMQVQSFRPHLVILDLMLPGVNGFDICRGIRNDEKTRHTRILAVTGYDTEDNRRKIFECGADLHLTKPFEGHELIEKIEALLK